MTTHVLSFYYGDRHFRKDYFADGNGELFPGYLTSLSQVRKELYHHFGAGRFDLYCITGTRPLKQITSDEQICRKLDLLPLGHTLKIIVADAGRTPRFGPQAVNYHSTREHSRRRHSAWEINWHFVYNHFKPWFPRTSCMCCGAPIHGVRYFRVQGTSFVSCAACYSRQKRSARRCWRCKELPWEDRVPSVPLSKYYSGVFNPKTVHLEYLLTRLGFLKVCSSGRYGFYQDRLASAVQKFRRYYCIEGVNMQEYDNRTAKVLANKVRQLQSLGAKYV